MRRGEGDAKRRQERKGRWREGEGKGDRKEGERHRKNTKLIQTYS